MHHVRYTTRTYVHYHCDGYDDDDDDDYFLLLVVPSVSRPSWSPRCGRRRGAGPQPTACCAAAVWTDVSSKPSGLPPRGCIVVARQRPSTSEHNQLELENSASCVGRGGSGEPNIHGHESAQLGPTFPRDTAALAGMPPSSGVTGGKARRPISPGSQGLRNTESCHSRGGTESSSATADMPPAL